MDKADINKKSVSARHVPKAMPPAKEPSLDGNDDNILRAGDIIPPYKHVLLSHVEPPELEIPRFNLAEKILAEQRKVIAVKRKAPSHKSILDTGYSIPVENRETESVRHAVMPPATLLLNQQEVIALIVARDIAQMCQYRMTYPASP